MKGRFVFERRCNPPQLWARLTGAITLDDIRGHVTPFEQTLDRMPSGFVFISHQLGLTDIDAEAMGVIFYLIPRIYDARPRALLIINRGGFIHPQLQSPVERFDPCGVLRVLDSETGATPWLRERTSLWAF